MPTAKLTFIPDIVEEHLEELQFLWQQRDTALRSPAYTLRELLMLEERIEAHVQGVLIAGENLATTVEKRLASEEAGVPFAAAYCLLRSHSEAGSFKVFSALTGAKANAFRDIHLALRHGPTDFLASSLARLISKLPSLEAAAAADVLWCHGAVQLTPEQVTLLMEHGDPAVRQIGWHIAGNVGRLLEVKWYGSALQDEDIRVRSAAMSAAAWSGQPGILVLCRHMAEKPVLENIEFLRLLAILGTAEDLSRLARISETEELGAARFPLLGSFGHPASMDFLLAHIAGSDPQSAAAAGAAFTKITGQNIDSPRRVEVPLDESGRAGESEFTKMVKLPDPDLAQSRWNQTKQQLSAAQRLCRGFDVTGGAASEVINALDMESRWELCMRARFYGTGSQNPWKLESFPQKPL